MTSVRDYFSGLWAERDRAIRLHPMTVRYRDGGSPQPSQCHANVDRWVAENPQHVAVRGWLVMSYGFERHSVVGEPDGRLVDITLAAGHPFLRHPGDQASFDALAQGFNQVFWPPV